MELTDLGYFRHVAHAGSFAEAARRAHVSGPAVSKAIKRLEQALEVPLFERTTRSVRLTDAGRLVLEHTERIFGAVSGLEQALDETHGVFKGPYRIALPTMLDDATVASAVVELSALQPGMQPNLCWLEGSAAEQAILDGQVDAAVRIGPPKSESLEWRPISTVRTILVCAPKHPLAKAQRIERQHLEAHPFAVTIDPRSLEPLDAFPREVARRTVGASVERLSLAVDLVCRGGLLGLFPQTAVTALIDGGRLVGLDAGFEVELELCGACREPSPIFKQWCNQLGTALAPPDSGNVETLPASTSPSFVPTEFASSAE